MPAKEYEPLLGDIPEDVEKHPPVDKTPVKRTRFAVAVNLFVIAVLATIMSTFGEADNGYITMGPSDSLVLMGLAISTWTRWALAMGTICLISTVDTITNEFGLPYISFRIYDPDVKVINDVGPIELQVLANVMYACTSLKNVIYTLAIVTQLDFALARVISAELTSIYTIRILIKGKRFTSEL